MACQAASHVSKKGLKCKEMVIDIPFVLEPPAWPECCIYRVPKKLRMVNKEAYTPKLITIGPLHNNYCREEFRDMEMQKLRYLREFCYRTGKSHEDLARIIEGKEVEIRHCYAETSELTSKEFVNMILLDGVFIIELFVRTFEKKEHDKKEMEKKEHEKKEYEDYLLSKPWLRDGIQHDLLLLENQLPFFVLEDLYMSGAEGQQMIKKQKDDRLKTLVLKDTHFLKLCREYFSKYDQRPNDNIDAKVKHFTDLLRYFFHPSYLKAKPKKAIDQLYSATKLDEAGVKFKKVKERHLLDIQFNKGTCLNYCPYLNCSWLLNCLPCLKCLFFLERMQPFLELPTFEVGHETNCVFRNIMALEQCHYPNEAYICNYILLLDCLINTEKDVDLLVEKKVILNQLGSHEALARLVNKLGHQIVAEDSCYFELSEKLNEHYEDFWNRNMATLTTTYFRDIWRGTATVVGIIFLLLTFWNIFLRHFVKMPRFRNN